METLTKTPDAVLRMAGVSPDPWQRELLRSAPREALLLASRQSGKSTAAAADCLRTALVERGALVLITSPTQRQSVELFRKVLSLYRSLHRPVASESVSKTALELANGSRIVALPGDPDTLVGFSNPRLIVIDEAARCSDELYLSVRPMLAVGNGRLLLCSTPFGPRGFFHREWSEGEGWHRTQVVATQCKRISPEFLERERRSLGERWYQQEYECSFQAAAGAVFDPADIIAAATVPAWVLTA